MRILIDSVNMFFNFLNILLLARIIMSWLMMGMRMNPLFAFIYNLTEPLLLPIRRLLAKSPLGGPGMMIDFSVLFLFLILRILHPIVISLIIQLFA